jgi:hypothetical protein
MVISKNSKTNNFNSNQSVCFEMVKLFRSNSAIIAFCLIFASTSNFAQNQFDFELSKNVISPTEGPKLFGYMGTVHYSFSNDLGISVATGYMKIEESSTYFRDQKNSLVNYENVSDVKIIPLILGGQYKFLSTNRIETFLEAESGLNLLIFEENLDNRIYKNHEIHLGIGMGGGANLLLTNYLKFVLKCKFNVATRIDKSALFNQSSRYVTFSTGLQIGL